MTRERREQLIAVIDKQMEANTKAYQKVRQTIQWESPMLDPFVGKATRLGNLRLALETYKDDKLAEMEKAFEALDE